MIFLPSESSISSHDDKEASFTANGPTVRKVALVTGAASGIGRALALHHAKQGGNLVITDKTSAGLHALKSELDATYKDIQVTAILADLSQPNGARSVYDQVKERGLEVDYLINNAGFAVWGSIIDRPLQDNLDLVQVMVASVVTLTSLFASDMVTRGIGGKILNVGSIADILPGGPYNSCYFASKAFISSFSHAVDHELRSKGVTCTLLAPGNTDSGLLKASGLDKARVAKAPRASPEHVAEVGYQAMLDGKLHVVCDRKSTALSWLIPFLPRRRVLKIIEDFHLPS